MTARIAICICTCARREQLALLLSALDRQRLPDLMPEVVAVIVDNSADGSAREVVARAAPTHRFQLIYVHEPRRGLAIARNRSLDLATAERADFVAFIDDDEMPPPNWIAELHSVLIHTGATAAIGPVSPVFAMQLPRWLPPSAYVVAREPDRNGNVADGYTSNAIVRSAAITAHGLRFDERFNETGGEDTDFFARLMRAGGEVKWAGKARIFENMPVGRMTLRWLCARWYRTGTVEAHLRSRPVPTASDRLANLGRGFIRVGAGGLRLMWALAGAAAGMRPHSDVVASLYTICRGAGYIAGAAGLSYREYAASRGPAPAALTASPPSR